MNYSLANLWIIISSMIKYVSYFLVKSNKKKVFQETPETISIVFFHLVTNPLYCLCYNPC